MKQTLYILSAASMLIIQPALANPSSEANSMHFANRVDAAKMNQQTVDDTSLSSAKQNTYPQPSKLYVTMGTGVDNMQHQPRALSLGIHQSQSTDIEIKWISNNISTQKLLDHPYQLDRQPGFAVIIAFKAKKMLADQKTYTYLGLGPTIISQRQEVRYHDWGPPLHWKEASVNKKISFLSGAYMALGCGYHVNENIDLSVESNITYGKDFKARQLAGFNLTISF
jgi:hypothetical protein